MFQFFALAAAVCRTAAGVPCFTLTCEHSVWARVKSTARDLVTAEEAGTMVNWKFKTLYGDSTASLAPGLDRQVLRLEAIEYRYRYLPVRKELFETKSLRRGGPDRQIFAPPKGK